MKIEERTVTEKVITEQINSFLRTIYIKDCPQNCKLTYISNINGFLGIPGDDTKKIFDEVLKECRMSVYLNTNTPIIKDWILKHYEVYSNTPIPIGYGGMYQYHIIIRNSITKRPSVNMRATEYGKDQEPVEKLKARIKDKLKKALKAKKRKTDLVDEVVDSLL